MIPEKQHHKLGKFLSFVLRHNPQRIGIELDEQGWIDIPTLLQQLNTHGKNVDRDTLNFIVANNNKKRYAIDQSTDKIRASQGHSVDIDLGYTSKKPPAILYHGTAERFLDSIFKTGLDKRSRHQVHLSADVNTAISVGQRHGKVIVIEVLAKEMHQDGLPFFISENEVWLTDKVPVKYLRRRK